jgi:mRNA interferase MazF
LAKLGRAPAPADVVVVPFADLSHAKRRPPLIVAELEGDDLILWQRVQDRFVISIGDEDFKTGGLKQRSNIRPNHLFTAHRQLVLCQAGHLKTEKLNEVIRKIIDL